MKLKPKIPMADHFMIYNIQEFSGRNIINELI